MYGLGCLDAKPEDLYFKGHISSYDLTMIEINVHECEPERLPNGQQCMSDEELITYWKSKVVFVAALTNYIDFGDIDNPVKSLVKTVTAKEIQLGEPQ